MKKKVLLTRVLPLCLAAAVLGGFLFIGLSSRLNIPDVVFSPFSLLFGIEPSNRPTGSITSDGLSYPVRSIEAVQIASQIPEEDLLPVVGDRETLLKLLLERGVLYDSTAQNYNYYGRNDMVASAESAAGVSVPSTTPGAAPVAPADTDMAPDQQASVSSDGASYSETNEQVAGINEGDIVKTDGQYIYAMSPYGGTLRIISVNGPEMSVVSAITFNDIWGAEFYLIGDDRIAITGQEYVPITTLPMPIHNDVVEPSADIMPDYYYGWNSRDFTVLLIYDISDRANPAEVRRVSMDGWTVSSRVIGNIVYLVTNKHMWSIPYDQADSPSILPYCLDSSTGEEFEPIAFDRIFYIPDTGDSSYMLVGALDVYGDDPFEPTAYLGAGGTLYMSHNAMYITKWRSDVAIGDRWHTWHQMTDIIRFAIDGTSIFYTGAGTADGSPINQYSMDEYNGYFRIATTDRSAGTYVTVLNAATMQTVGRTEPLAPGEQMQSMRFMGDMGYVVTFENVDPLFTIDLSDPYNPKMLGELKIPGFSQYLHPVGDGLLLGIGRDTQEIFTRDSSGVETVIGFRDTGLKVSLFDVSNPFDPIEAYVLLLGEGWSEVSHNPRALMSDSTRGLYGFFMENRGTAGRWGVDALLVSVDVDSGRLSVAATFPVEYSNMYSSRLCYIGNILYVVHENGIDSYDYSSFTKLASITF